MGGGIKPNLACSVASQHNAPFGFSHTFVFCFFPGNEMWTFAYRSALFYFFYLFYFSPLSGRGESAGGGADLAVIHFIPLYRSGSMAFVMQVGGIVLIFLSDPLSDPTLQKWNSWNNGRRAGPLPFPRQEVFKF